MSTLPTIVAAIAALGAACLGGLYFAFSTAVMPALGRRPGAEAAAAMQEINRVIVNPAFMLLFVGTGLAGLATIVMGVLGEDWLLVVGAAAALAGGHLITMAANIPLNNALDRARPGVEAWERFAGPWNRAHALRTLLTLAGAVVIFVDLLLG
jgi:uncharacterized membrane protein